MKKLFIVALAAAFCLAFAMPAMAKVTVGGTVTVGFAYEDIDGEYFDGGRTAGQASVSDGEEATVFNLLRALNQIRVTYASDDNNVRGLIEIRGGEVGGSDTPGGEPFVWNYSWIDWQITPNFYLRFGRQTQAAAILGPGFITGSNQRQTWFGYGESNGATSKDGVRAYIKFNDMIRLEIAAYDPADDDEQAVAPLARDDARNLADYPTAQQNGITGAALTAAGLNEESTIPRFDIALPIDIAGFHLEPSVYWSRTQFDWDTAVAAVASSDDEVDAWGAFLGFSGGFGPLVFAGEVWTGENMGNGNSPTTMIPFSDPLNIRFAQFYQPGGAGTQYFISDTEFFGFWAEAGIKFGPARLMFYYGYVEADNEVDPNLPLDNLDWEVQSYGVYMPITVAKGFSITPEILIADFDDGALDGVNNPNTADYGGLYQVGVRFQLAF